MREVRLFGFDEEARRELREGLKMRRKEWEGLGYGFEGWRWVDEQEGGGSEVSFDA